MDKNFIIKKNNTIKKAMQLISLNQNKCLVVVNGSNKLLGTLSDGDIRNALIKGYKLSSIVNKIFNKNSKFIFKDELNDKKLRRLFLETNFDIIPVVNRDKIVIDIKNWSQPFLRNNKKNISNKNKKENLNLSVVIMAGGEGTRMKPFTNILPKPLIPINDKPVIVHIMDKFKKQGVSNFIFTVNHKAEIIKAYFKELKNKEKIKFINEKLPLGTAGSLKELQHRMKKSFFVINCDTIINIDCRDLYNFHVKKNNMITIIASAKEYTIPYGICNINRSGQLKGITEKPKMNFLASSGIYVVNPLVLKLIPKNKKYDFPELISEAKKRKMKIGVFPIDDNSWLDVGQWGEYKKTISLLGVDDE